MKIWSAEVKRHRERAYLERLMKVEKEAFSVQTKDGLLKVLELQIPGKKRMDAGAFLRGYQVKSGEILSRA